MYSKATYRNLDVHLPKRRCASKKILMHIYGNFNVHLRNRRCASAKILMQI